MQEESHHVERSGRNVTEQGHRLSFPQDQMQRKQVASQHWLPAGVRKIQMQTRSSWERQHFWYWITQLGGLFLRSLGKSPVIMGILLAFFLFSLLLVECNFREELLWLWGRTAAYSTYSMNIYRAFAIGEALCLERRIMWMNKALSLISNSTTSIHDDLPIISSLTSPRTAHFLPPCCVPTTPFQHLSHWTVLMHLGAHLS